MNKILLGLSDGIELPNDEIVVTVLVTTYNHEKYIRQCLEGILNQKTTYKFEILIHDDASPDDTPSIIREYHSKYPTKVFAILQKENILSKGKKIHYEYMPFVNGQYIATCEGDDYWIDDNKLQKQVKFLEKNQNYTAVYHRAIIVDKNSVSLKRLFPVNYRNNTFTRKCINRNKLPGQTATKVYRNFWHSLDVDMINAFLNCKGIGDRKIVFLLSLLGKVYCMNDIMSAYRYVLDEGTSWSATNKDINRSIIDYESINELNEFSKKYFNIEPFTKNIRLRLIWQAFVFFIKHRSRENYLILREIIRLNNDVNNVYIFSYIILRVLTFPLNKITNKYFYWKATNKYPHIINGTL